MKRQNMRNMIQKHYGGEVIGKNAPSSCRIHKPDQSGLNGGVKPTMKKEVDIPKTMEKLFAKQIAEIKSSN